MEHLHSLIQTHSNNYLWPTIADTIDTFLRRRARNSDNYERIWRLIHIWEATEVTLGVAAMSKLSYERQPIDPVFRKCREYFYGMFWNQVDREFRTSNGAVDGSIDQWLNILNEISKDTTINDDGFLKSLKNFLNVEEINLRRFVQAWSRSCDVPNDTLQKDKFSTKTAMRHINSFRNRFAHVPFPHDPLSELAVALEETTAQLFSITPSPSKHHEKDVGSSPLTGSFTLGNFLLRGALHLQNSRTYESVHFSFPSIKSASEKFTPETWSAIELVHVDEMMRPHIIARIKGESGTIEYVRFKAEANAIATNKTEIDKRLPKPNSQEYQTEDDKKVVEEIKKTSETTFKDAIDANRNGDYDIAIKFFDELTKKDYTYHVAWLNLGYAQREKAVRTDDPKDAISLLRDSIKNLSKSTEHIDREYQARAYYELSKAHYQLSKKVPENKENLENSGENALEAVERSSDPKYRTWLEYIDNCMKEQR